MLFIKFLHIMEVWFVSASDDNPGACRGLAQIQPYQQGVNIIKRHFHSIVSRSDILI